MSGAPGDCVDALLEASVKYSPHFDWVVAHIGCVLYLKYLMWEMQDFNKYGLNISDILEIL